MGVSALKFLLILFLSRQGLICLFSFLSLIFISSARKKYKEGILKEMVDNMVALAFITYLFTFFNILFSNDFVQIKQITSELILNAFIVLVLIIIIKATIDIMNFSNKNKTNPISRKVKNPKRKR